MWSGPRNISTAMMRAWENRTDTQVIDEPFYSHFLHHTGLDHPMADAVISHGETDWRKIVQRISQVPEHGIVYQKQITTHWLEHYSVDWLDNLSHVFLIRDPAPVVASYASKRPALTASDLGYQQQAALFDLVSTKSADRPIVIDSHLFLQDPQAQLKQLCTMLQIPFQSSMLKWPSGSRQSDGIWGEHWYDAVNQSTGFGQPRTAPPQLTEHQQAIAALCQPYYDALKRFAIT